MDTLSPLTSQADQSCWTKPAGEETETHHFARAAQLLSGGARVQSQSLRRCAGSLSVPRGSELSQSPASQVALVVKKLPASAGGVRDMRSVPGLGRSPRGGPGSLLQDSCLENPMDRGAWRAIVHRVTKGWTQVK